MERPPLEQTSGDESAHQEAVEFVNRHRDFIEHYARGQVHIEPSPAGLDTFAFDLERDAIYVNSRFYTERGFSDAKTAFATLHELEHFLEKKQLLAEPGGAHAFSTYLEQIKKSKAFGLMDNCVADIRENQTVVTKNESMGMLEENIYRQDLFPTTDFTAEPRHVQFSYALLRESRVPNDVCTVAPEVREKLDALKAVSSADGTRLLDAMTHPDTPMSLRLKLQQHYIWPMMRELLEKDIEEKKAEPAGEGGPADPNELFAEVYKRADEKVLNAVPMEKVEEAFGKWQESQGKNPLQRADREYAERLGVKDADLKRYRDLVKLVEDIRNPATNELVMEELRSLIERIIARRLKLAPTPRYPVEEGEDLVDPAELVAQVKAGNLEPKVWETDTVAERRGARYGEVEITLVFDRSGSMGDPPGAKLTEQQKCGVMSMEVLKEFSQRCQEERVNVEKPLEVRSEMYSFQASQADSQPLKSMSAELAEKERIDVATALASAPGSSTTDFVTLETIDKEMSEEDIQKITEGELKKIVIVFTDGESDDPDKVQIALNKLRGKGVVVVGVGITQAGEAALTTYAPEARLARRAEELSLVLADVLKEHLADL